MKPYQLEGILEDFKKEGYSLNITKRDLSRWYCDGLLKDIKNEYDPNLKREVRDYNIFEIVNSYLFKTKFGYKKIINKNNRKISEKDEKFINNIKKYYVFKEEGKLENIIQNKLNKKIMVNQNILEEFNIKDYYSLIKLAKQKENREINNKEVKIDDEKLIKDIISMYVNYYEIHREKLIIGQTKNKEIHKDYFFESEVLCRLNRKDLHLIYKISKEIETREFNFNRGKKIMILKKSFFEWLKNKELIEKDVYSTKDFIEMYEPFFSEKINKEQINITLVDRILKKEKIGQKIIDTNQGNYILTEEEILGLNEILKNNSFDELKRRYLINYPKKRNKKLEI